MDGYWNAVSFGVATMFGVPELVKLFNCVRLMFSVGDSSQAAGDEATSRNIPAGAVDTGH
jgi:hypothetical protein